MRTAKEFLDSIIGKAQANPRNVVLPEGTEERVIQATKIILDRKIARVTLLGDTDEIREGLRSSGTEPKAVRIVDPLKSEHLSDYTDCFYELRKHKNISLAEAEETIRNPVYFGTMMLHTGEADGLVSGATHPSALTIRPALQIIKPRAGVATVSSLFFMCLDEAIYGFADCSVVENPEGSELAEIAAESLCTAVQFGLPPRMALLSYSTKGSAASPLTEKVAKATTLAKERIARDHPEWNAKIDGPLQFDAAVVPDIARRKCPDSPIQGNARILIFPDLNAGNIAYKAVERLAGAKAYGPILQGLRKPVNDLSRGCSVDDIMAVTAITAVQAGRNT